MLFNRSALACLIGNVLVVMPRNAVLLSLSSSFYRQTFLVDKLFMSFAFIGASIISIVGSLVGGSLANKVGRKRLTVISSLLLGVVALAFINMPDLGLSLMVWMIGAFFMGVVNTAYNSLALEQAPDNRATMMSLSEVSMYAAIAVDNAFAGVLLLAFNYNIVSLLGLLSFIGTIVFYFFTIDPTQQAKQ